MKLKINAEITLETGETTSEAIIKLDRESLNPQKKQFTAYACAWASQAMLDNGMGHTHLRDNNEQTAKPDIIHLIPQADLDAAEAAGNYANLGTNYPSYVKQAIIAITGVTEAQIEIQELI